MTVRKCDACKKTIPKGKGGVEVYVRYAPFELCEKCAVPVLAVLKKYKITIPV